MRSRGVIGYLTTHERIRRGRSLVVLLSRISRDLCIDVCAFSHRDIDRRALTVRCRLIGPNYSSDETVVRPIPRVIRHREPMTLTAAIGLRGWVRDCGCSVLLNEINHFDKLAVNRLLARDPAICPAIPAFWELSHRTFVALYSEGSVYVKRRVSYNRNGMIEVRRTPNTTVLKFDTNGRQVQQRRVLPTTDPDLVYEEVERLISSKHRYFVQSAAPVAEVQGDPFDLRLITQRGASGAWQVTGTYAKIISDVQGSVRVRVVPALPVLEFLFGDKAVDVIGSLRSLAVRIAEGIGGTGDYCDLGLDLAVSNSGQIFFFESNGRHDISIPYNVGDLDIWVAAVRTPMEYCYTRLIS